MPSSSSYLTAPAIPAWRQASRLEVPWGFSKVHTVHLVGGCVICSASHMIPHSSGSFSCVMIWLRLQVQFSPDGRWIATASFDKGVKLWDGYKGSFVATFRHALAALPEQHPPPEMWACL